MTIQILEKVPDRIRRGGRARLYQDILEQLDVLKPGQCLAAEQPDMNTASKARASCCGYAKIQYHDRTLTSRIDRHSGDDGCTLYLWFVSNDD